MADECRSSGGRSSEVQGLLFVHAVANLVKAKVHRPDGSILLASGGLVLVLAFALPSFEHHRLAVLIRMQPDTVHQLAIVVENELAAVVVGLTGRIMPSVNWRSSSSILVNRMRQEL